MRQHGSNHSFVWRSTTDFIVTTSAGHQLFFEIVPAPGRQGPAAYELPQSARKGKGKAASTGWSAGPGEHKPLTAISIVSRGERGMKVGDGFSWSVPTLFCCPRLYLTRRNQLLHRQRQAPGRRHRPADAQGRPAALVDRHARLGRRVARRDRRLLRLGLARRQRLGRTRRRCARRKRRLRLCLFGRAGIPRHLLIINHLSTYTQSCTDCPF